MWSLQHIPSHSTNSWPPVIFTSPPGLCSKSCREAARAVECVACGSELRGQSRGLIGCAWQAFQERCWVDALLLRVSWLRAVWGSCPDGPGHSDEEDHQCRWSCRIWASVRHLRCQWKEASLSGSGEGTSPVSCVAVSVMVENMSCTVWRCQARCLACRFQVMLVFPLPGILVLLLFA